MKLRRPNRDTVIYPAVAYPTYEMGAVLAGLGRIVLRPTSFRLTSTVHHLEQVCWRAVPIILLITFLIGCIIAQQGIFHFRKFGAESYVVDMVGILVLREIGVLIVAIMVAGRSGSSYTAELGSMMVTDQINALRALGRNAEAIASYDRALSVMPQHSGALRNRGLALAALNRHQEAVASFAQAIVLKPDDADAHFDTAMSLLTLGDYPRGFAEYEWRWKRAGMNAKPRFRQPLWLGETPLGSKTILLHAEQGLGDTIQFVRYATLLARGGARVLLEVQPELKDLLSQIEGAAGVFTRGETLPNFDVQCPLMSLPLALKTTPQTIPAEGPYLRADAARLATWKPELDKLAAPRVAIAWSGRATHINDRNRSLTLAALEPLLALSNVRFVSIQRDPRPADAERLAADPRILHLGDRLEDFSDTAAVLALTDLLIAVDTSVLHLAGALGRPAWGMIPFQPDWRWGLAGNATSWYPGMELFRQPEPGDWTNVINQMTEKLASAGAPVP